MMSLIKIKKSTVTLRAALCGLCISVLPLAQADETELTPKDFYKGAELEVSAPSPFYRLTLPEDVYLETVYPDLRDVRVFNSSGQTVTFALSPVDSDTTEQQNIPLRIFPMQMSVNKPDENRREDKETFTFKSAGGVEVKLYQDGERKPQATYLLELNQDKDKSDDVGLNQIMLDWAQSNANWQAKVTLYSSRDLKDWRKQADNAPLMDLTSGTDRLLLNNIDLDDNYNSRRAQYWLLVVNSDENVAIPAISKAQGVVITRRTAVETIELAFKSETVSKTEAIYQLQRPQPLSSLSIVPEQSNTVLPVNIEYRSTEQDKWRPLSTAVVYQIHGDTGYRTSEPLAMNHLLVQGIRVKAVNGNWGDTVPKVVAQRERVDVLFNGQGNPPYLLAWGANQAAKATIGVNQLIPASEMQPNGLQGLPQAYVGNTMVLGGEERLTATSPIERAQQWQTWLLWGLLIVGVVGLALVVLRLARELMEPKGK
ncbi:MAG: DUF3999 domain-containing protein [Limnobaculum xujianqingii]